MRETDSSVLLLRFDSAQRDNHQLLTDNHQPINKPF